MVRFDHFSLAVSDYERSRDWYRTSLGLQVEFEIAGRTAAMHDDSDFTIFLSQSGVPVAPDACVLYFQVDDVGAKYSQLSSAGVPFVHAPQKKDWGYGAELQDPDGYRVRLWDQRSMREHGGG